MTKKREGDANSDDENGNGAHWVEPGPSWRPLARLIKAWWTLRAPIRRLHAHINTPYCNTEQKHSKTNFRKRNTTWSTTLTLPLTVDGLKSAQLNFVKQKIEIFATQVYVFALISLAIFLHRTVQYLIFTLELFVVGAACVWRSRIKKGSLFSQISLRLVKDNWAFVINRKNKRS